MINKYLLKRLVLFILVIILSKFCFAEDLPKWWIERKDLLNVTVNSVVTFDQTTLIYKYSYTIESHADSAQNMKRIEIEYESTEAELRAPLDWDTHPGRIIRESYVTETRTPNNKLAAKWYTIYKEKMINPGSSLCCLIIKSKGLPVIVTLYAQGDAPKPKIENWQEQKALRGQKKQAKERGDIKETKRLNKLIIKDVDWGPENPELKGKYVNSFKGKTLGPVDPPDPFVPVTFTDTIIGYVTESGTLGWISDTAVKNSITANLNTAKGKIGTDNPGAITLLDTILSDLETQHGGASPTVNDAAYFLIKFNVMYLKDRL